MTHYAVFRFTEEGHWKQIHHLDARSANAAIRDALERSGDEGDAETYVAVPSRSFRPVSVTVQTETKIKIG